MSLQIYDYYLNGARKMGENFEKQYILKLLPLLLYLHLEK